MKMKRYDLTKDTNHCDYIIPYSELDRTYSQLHLSLLDAKTKRKYMKKQVIGEDDKPHNVWLYVCTEIYCAFDIETSTVKGVNIVNGKEGYYSAMYLAQFGINDHVVLFRTWNEVMMFFQKLPRLLRLSACTCLMVWVHNLDYENSYIKHRFDIDQSTYFGKNKQHPIKYLLQHHFIMHDSYSVTNSSLAKLAEMYNTPHKKAVGDLDHSIPRNYKTVLNDTEIGYAANDVLVLCDFAKVMFEDFFKKRGYIPDTATQILNREMRENAVKYAEQFIGSRRYKKIQDSYDEEQQEYMILKSIHGKIFGFDYTDAGAVHHVEGIVDPHFFTPFDDKGMPIGIEGREIYDEMYYDFYEWLFRGGYTKSNARFTSTDTINIEGVTDVEGYDYTSSYPFVQTICTYPMSRFTEVSMTLGNMCRLKLEYGENDFEKWRYILICEFYDIRSTDDFALESQHKAHIEGHKTIDNGRIQYADKMTVCLTECDFALYKLYYKWNTKKSRIIKCWRAKAERLPDYLLYTLWDNGAKKASLKGIKGMEVEYMLAKQKFNASFGLSCKQPVYVEYKLGNTVTPTGYQTEERVNFKYFGKSDIFSHSLCDLGEAHTMTKDECKEYDFLDSVKSSILSPFWGIWVSAFARYNLLSCMKKISNESEWIINDVLYCDTDSMYFVNAAEHIHIINDWNVWAAERVKSILPARYESLLSLGQFDNVAVDDSNGYSTSYQRFKTLGAKRYVKQYTTTKKRKHIKSIYTKQSVTVAGLPKGTLENYCHRHHLNIFDVFSDNMDFVFEGNQELVKLARTYHDELVKVNIAGEIMTEYSSCTLYPNTFKVKMLPIYKSFISSVLEGSGAKTYARGFEIYD